MVYQAETKDATGPLKIHPDNPRYFIDGSGKVVYLTGSHTWGNLQDYGETNPPPVFDYTGYLDFMQQHNHNFMRMWMWESPHAKDKAGSVDNYYTQPMHYERTGPGKANDGGPKFDITKFNQQYFDRLRSRVIAAGERGIYVSVMLFEGWSVKNFIPGRQVFIYHPYYPDNNINGINGDPNNSGEGLETHSLKLPAITLLQEAYVRKVIDTVNDLDNVLYEISNESALPRTKDWQYYMINYIKQYEAGKPKQHPVGMTGHSGPIDQYLFDSPADWISPGTPDYHNRNNKEITNPLATDGRKVIIQDTDHLGAMYLEDDAAFSRAWVWKTFTRGYNPILMEMHQTNPMGDWRAGFVAARKAMGQTLAYASKMNLVAMTPRNDLASTQYCLANPGREYLIYQPEKGECRVILEKGTYSVEWFNPSTGNLLKNSTISVQAGACTFKAPFAGDAVLYLAICSE
ncbi:hypothetical protein FJZ31_00980 [Candidatus Poribacteria bacterium]|nr:hypothetical protein [Candidatus Poribacteria bacterium]